MNADHGPPPLQDISQDLSAWIRRLADFTTQARTLGIPLRIDLSYEFDGHRTPIASFMSSPLKRAGDQLSQTAPPVAASSPEDSA